jgi:hypothetical protein
MLSKNIKVRRHFTLILSVVLYGYETWSLTMKEEHRLRVFESRVLRRYLGLRGSRSQQAGKTAQTGGS